MAPATVKSVLAERPVFHSTLSRIAGVFNERVNDLIATVPPPPPTADPVVDGLLAQSIDNDVRGETLNAITIAEAILKLPNADPIEQCASVSIQLAAFYDHNGEWPKALSLLDSVLGRLDSAWDHGDLHLELRNGVLYQKSINLLKMGMDSEAEMCLLQILTEASLKTQRVSALHHLGVIDVKRAAYESAEAKFQRCLVERGTGDKNRRTAYEYRRIAQVYALTGRPGDALSAYELAMATAMTCNFDRYTILLRQEMACLSKCGDLKNISAAAKIKLRRCFHI